MGIPKRTYPNGISAGKGGEGGDGGEVGELDELSACSVRGRVMGGGGRFFLWSFPDLERSESLLSLVGMGVVGGY